MFFQEYSGSVLWVIDGDTFVFQTEVGNLKVRMYGIDAPEKNQEFGLESKKFMEKYLHKTGSLKKTGVDKYGRTLGILFIKNVNINLESIKKGCAWHYKYYCSNKDFEQAQKKAMNQKIDLWKYNNPTPPWDYRRMNKK
jgi:micrococcal nuclease